MECVVQQQLEMQRGWGVGSVVGEESESEDRRAWCARLLARIARQQERPDCLEGLAGGGRRLAIGDTVDLPAPSPLPSPLSDCGK